MARVRINGAEMNGVSGMAHFNIIHVREPIPRPTGTFEAVSNWWVTTYNGWFRDMHMVWLAG